MGVFDFSEFVYQHFFLGIIGDGKLSLESIEVGGERIWSVEIGDFYRSMTIWILDRRERVESRRVWMIREL